MEKNSKDISVVALGEHTHKVMDCVPNHRIKLPRETKDFVLKHYEKMESKNVSIKIHSHDRNFSRIKLESTTSG